MEFVGIHGERAATRAPFRTAGELVHPLVAELELRRGDGVLVFVNGMGATHPQELSVCFREVHTALGALGIAVTRCVVTLMAIG